MTDPTAGEESALTDWLAVEGDLDDFIFYAAESAQSEK